MPSRPRSTTVAYGLVFKEGDLIGEGHVERGCADEDLLVIAPRPHDVSMSQRVRNGTA